MAPKKVSIILPTYNGTKYLKEAVLSCLKQEYKDIELIVVDDCSSENISGFISGIKDDRMKVLRHKKNLGLSAALNTGFKVCTGDYLTWTSDDNVYDKAAIGRLAKALQNDPGCSFVYSDYRITNERD